MSSWRVSAGWAVGILVLLTGADASAQVDPKNPFESPKVLLGLDPLPGATGPLIDSPVNKTTPKDVHEGVYTWGKDLVDPGTGVEATWFDHIYPTPPAEFAFTASPNFIVRLKDPGGALDWAQQQLDDLDAGTAGDAFELFDLLAGKDVTVPQHSKDWFFGFWPVRARWLKSQWAPTGEVFWLVEKKFNYADYAPFEDIRLRGARLYCAARRVQFAQGGSARSLGERVGFSINLMGHTIDFLVVEATVAIDGPAKFMAPLIAGVPTDGAQAFAIPFQFGTRVTPIRGLPLPSLGEARIPVVLVTGDTEVKTASYRRRVFDVGPFGLYSRNVFSETHHTVTHADAILSAGYYNDQSYVAEKEFPLFGLGPLMVKGLLKLTYEVGKPFLFTKQVDMPWHPDDRVLQVAPWPNTARTGHLYQNPGGLRYHDGAWLLAKRRRSPYFEWQVQPEGSKNLFWTDPIVEPSSTDIRALTNDDHKFATSTQLGLTLGLKGELGATAGPFTVSANVKGTFTGTVAQNHVLRDALMAQDPPPGFLNRMVPSTMVSVRPQQTAAVTFDGVKASLLFDLDLWFDSIHFEQEFFDVPGTTLADYDSFNDWTKDDERYMLRIGTGSALGNTMSKPVVFSHLPGGQDLPTFLQNVSTCLADPAEPPPLNPPCPPEPGSGEVPTIDICIYGPSLALIEKAGSKNVSLPELPPNACTALGSWPSGFGFDGNPALKACFADYVNLLCEAKSQQQSWDGKQVVSHKWNLDPVFAEKLHAVLEQCAAVFQAPETPIEPEVKEILSGLLSVGPCDTNALLVPKDSVIQAVSPKQAPKPKPGSCAP